MKKLLSIAAVAAIVTSAFAFNSKALTFCVFDAAVNDCVIIREKVADPAGQNFLEFPLAPGQWNGTQNGCTAATPADCDIPIKLDDN